MGVGVVIRGLVVRVEVVGSKLYYNRSFLTCNCSPPSAVAPTFESDPVATDDHYVGSLIVVDEGAASTISLNVTSDPCPTVMWSFNDVPIPVDTTEYTITNPCDNGSVAAGAIYTFTLTIPSVTEATSGSYTAEFITEGVATSILASTYVTSPGRPGWFHITSKILLALALALALALILMCAVLVVSH